MKCLMYVCVNAVKRVLLEQVSCFILKETKEHIFVLTYKGQLNYY